MIEQAMFLALGASLAGLVALIVLPAIAGRANRLARADIERQMPLSAREIVSQRDLLRAEFAAERRRLEQAHETATQALAQERIVSGQRTVEASGLAATLAQTTAARETADQAQAQAERAMRETASENAALQKALYDADGVEARLRFRVAALTEAGGMLERTGAELRSQLTAGETAAGEQAARLEALERALMQARLDLSLSRAHGETQAAQIDAHEERMRVASATESDLRRRLAAQEQAALEGGDLASLRRTIVEIGREVVRLAARDRAQPDAQDEPPAPAPAA